LAQKKRWPEEEDLHLRKETDAFGQRILPSLRLERSELTMRCPYDQHLFADEVGIWTVNRKVLFVCDTVDGQNPANHQG